MSRGKSKDEGADSYAAIVARLNENWRIIVCTAGVQWILQCRGEKYGGVSFASMRARLIPRPLRYWLDCRYGSRNSVRSGPRTTRQRRRPYDDPP
jgi:hypothetical protein